MIKINIYNHRSFFEYENESEYDDISKSLRVWTENFKSFFNKGKKPFTSLLYKKDNSFPTGFLDEFCKRLKRRKKNFTITDHRKPINPHCKYKLQNFDYKLWENQTKSIEAIKKNHWGTISLPTGSGKTNIIAATVDYYKVKTLIIVPSVSIQEQTYELFVKYFGQNYVGFDAPKTDEYLTAKRIEYINKMNLEKINNPEKHIKKSINKASLLYDNDEIKKESNEFIEDEKIISLREKLKTFGVSKDEKTKIKQEIKKIEFYHNQKIKQKENYEKYKAKQAQPKEIKLSKKQTHDIYGYDISIVCFQSLSNLSPDYLKTVECVIIDEAHHASAKTIRNCMAKMPNAYYRYAFSATPWRDKKSEELLLFATIGSKVLYEMKGYTAVQKGIIVKPEMYYVRSPQPDVFLLKTKHWRTIVEKGIIYNKTRNESIVRLALELSSDGENVFICVDEVEHMNELQKMFEKKKKPALIIYGKLNKKEKRARIKTIGENKESLISMGTMAVGEGTDMPEITTVLLVSYGKATIRFLQRIGRGVRKTDKKSKSMKMKVYDYEDWFNPTLLKHFDERKKTFKHYYNDPLDE